MRKLPVLVVGFTVAAASLAALAAAHAGTRGLPAPRAGVQAGPSASELRERTSSCGRQVSNGTYAHDAGGTRSVPICSSGGAVFWTADFDVDCDGQRTTQCNENTDPWFQPDTAFHESDGQPLNSAALPFIVVPGVSSTWDFRGSGVAGGTVAAVVYRDRVAYAVVGDVGPTGAIGEGSYRLAQLLGINPDPRTGGVSGAVVTFIAFPGVRARPIEDPAKSVARGESAAASFVRPCLESAVTLTSYPTMRYGASGSAVTALQCRLVAAGYHPYGSGPITGRFDSPTEVAVRAFQADRGLSVDGVVGRSSWTALLSTGDWLTLRNGSSGEHVRRLQRSLTAALSRTVDADGSFGARTEQAVKDYQSSRGLTADGVAGRNTWGALTAGR